MNLHEKDIMNDIAKYLQGNRDEVIIASIKAWLLENDQNKVVFDEVREIWNSLNASEEQQSFNVNKAWNKYSNWIDKQESLNVRNSLKKLTIKITKYAAVIAIVVFGVITTYNYFGRVQELDYITTTIPNGQMGSVTLVDGSHVRLNGGSQLMCQSSPSLKERRVKLIGEGYFQVKHNPRVPFYVDVNNITIKVYGTEFNVDGYENEDYTETTLIEGKVGVQLKNGDEYIIKPNEVIRVSRDDLIEIAEDAEAFKNIHWLNNAYKFKNEPLSNIVKQIEHMFGMRVVIQSSQLANEKYTGQFDRSESIDLVLQRLVMSSPFKVDYSISNNEIFLHKN